MLETRRLEPLTGPSLRRRDPLALVGLRRLMVLTQGDAGVVIGLVDGPVALDHPDLATGRIRSLAGTAAACRDRGSTSCRHGTFVAGILGARRGAPAPAIAPGCSLLVRPVFSDAGPPQEMPNASPTELAAAIVDCVEAGARVINVSAALSGGTLAAGRELEEALEFAGSRQALVVAAAGNQGAVGGSVLTRSRWVIPVVAYGLTGRLLPRSNLGRSIGIRGLGGPGADVTSLAPDGGSVVAAGTSVAAPFVSGAAALIWSLFRTATAAELKRALLPSTSGWPRTITPRLLDAWRTHDALSVGR